jgi:adenosylmethionine-8-amino-7-oxononanoate aminotransferase
VPVAGQEQEAVAQMKKYLENADEIAAFIFEPLIQGAGGMVMYEPEVLEELIALAKDKGVITIADEIMTGFGRTGKMFATDYIQTKPDIYCMSKGLTGGAMALGVTTCTQEIFDAFLSEDRRKTLFHSHSFTANPLACTAALASLDLLLLPETQAQIKALHQSHVEFAQKLKAEKASAVDSVRVRGTILAIEIHTEEGTSYFSNIRDMAYNFFLEKGILMRPLGNIIYLLTPYCIQQEDLDYVYACIEEFLDFK